MSIVPGQIKKQLKANIMEILKNVKSKGGIAFGTGNSVPEYVPTENYIYMTEIIREYRNS